MANSLTVKFDHAKLTTLYVGQFGEQLIKLNFIVNQIDTFEPTIDDKGIDFVARVSDEKFYDVQVKTIRLKKRSYIYIPKSTWNNKLRENLLVAFVVLQDNLEPVLLLVPSVAWQHDLEGKIFTDYDYNGKKSKPEWGINLHAKSLDYLKTKYAIDQTLQTIRGNERPADSQQIPEVILI